MARKVTIEDLAVMVKRGFDETAKKDEVNKRFDKIEDRLDRIENLILKRHEQDLTDLKRRVKGIEDLFAMPMRK